METKNSFIFLAAAICMANPSFSQSSKQFGRAILHVLFASERANQKKKGSFPGNLNRGQSSLVEAGLRGGPFNLGWSLLLREGLVDLAKS
jgi:hypothetical protein